MIRLSGQSPVRIYPASETDFFTTEVDSDIAFSRDESGTWALLTLLQNGRRLQGKRFDPPALSSAELEDYAGIYRSDELAVRYVITREGMDLFLKVGDTPRQRLWYVQKDDFEMPMRMRFERDEENRITGFRLYAGRVRDIRFQKENGPDR